MRRKIRMQQAALVACIAALTACGGGNDGPRFPIWGANPGTPPPTGPGNPEPGAAPTLSVVSNRADLVSGGNALVEVRTADGVYEQVKVMRDGQDVSAAFALRENGRYMGLVEGLAVGANTLTATVGGGRAASLQVTNHPLGGPVFSGPQVDFWECTTKVASPTASNPDLGDALDAQCNIAAPVVRYQYRTLAGAFANYDPASPPDSALIARTTTDAGHSVPYIVRIERGVINRGKYDIAMLASPTDVTARWQPWQSVDNWNRKLYWKFGSGCEFGRTQTNPGSVMDHVALSRGFMVASSEMTNYGSHCNDVTSAETVMMLKEHITEQYGPIRYTIGEGNSGGAHQQHLHATNYPGLLQGILPSNGWQDTWTTGREFADCGLLKRFYDGGSAGLSYTVMNRANIAGHRWNQVCEGPANVNMASRTAFYIDPTVGGQGCGTHPNRWSLANLGGIRCTLQDFNIAIFGARGASGYARTPLDNVGVQYGLVALNKGEIDAEQFVALNEQIGGYDINGQWQPSRMRADEGAARIAHASGRVAHGKGLGEVAIIAGVNWQIQEEHYDFRNYVIRNRILEHHGDHDNQVLWRYKGNPPDFAERRFATMNDWLAAVEQDQSSTRTSREKIIANKPALATDSCWSASAGWSTDAALCNTSANPHTQSTITGSGASALYEPAEGEWPVWRDTRVAAGEDLTSDTMQCQLKPLVASDYPISFTTTQWSRLNAVFADGVCDHSKPGQGQSGPPEQWLSYMDGPGGKPLGAAPQSR
ncbi:DUF6351 family protein [Xenophilus arseniciresistens]|uniref:DUF6351 family protein n=1 Tax=Xenophilus arseniciresistens TaxID=1283306 RepID=A0AAE3T0V2_9BURK|nr:DUF6351 family protein [Xenophilus arseniciresistens]MDA7418607.1 DUF6351 family protein [Xenophilus arseniciresistens]